MATNQYTAAERGGGSGDTGRMRAAILQSVNTWMGQAKWVDPDKADRIQGKLNEAPERFISPDPAADYQEEASRVYQKIKEEYALRTRGDIDRQMRDWDDRADRHVRRKRRETGFETYETDDSAFRFDPIDVELVDRPTTDETETVELPDPIDRPTLVTRPRSPEPAEAAEPVDESEMTAETTESSLSILADILLGIFRIILAILGGFGETKESTSNQTQQKITTYQ